MKKRFNRKSFGIVLTALLIFSNFFSILPGVATAANADGSMTVSEALATYSNDGSTGTVEGYIVGHATGATSSNYTAPFSNDYNFLIADSPTEQDKTKVMDVQISSGYRSEFGLQTNPDNIGKKVKVTGTFNDYNVFPGIKSLSELVFVNGTTPQDPATISIAEARTLSDNDNAVISGIVTTSSGAFGGKSVYVQDDTAGIYVYQDTVDLVLGDKVTVTGTKTTYNSEVEISATTVEKIGTDAVPAPVELTPATVTEQYAGQLVTLSDVTVSDRVEVGTYGSFSFFANAGADKIYIYVDNRTGLTKEAVSDGDKVNVRGVVAPSDTGFEIKPTQVGDISPALASGNGKKVLFDNTHGETAGAADWVIDGGFSDFADGLKADGFTVDQLERSIPYTFGEQAITLEKLQQYDVFIMGEANIPFKASEQQAILDYVEGGGSIFFIGDHYNADRNLNRWDAGEVFNGYRRGAFEDPTKGMSTEEANSAAMQGVTSSDWLATNFGLKFRSNALGDITSGETVVAPNDSFGITNGVTTVEMHAGGTLGIINPSIAKGLIYMPENPPAWGPAVDEGVYNGGGIDEGAFAAISKVGAGKAAFIGDSSPVEDATPKYTREDGGSKTTYDGFSTEGQNDIFLVQTVEWLANHEDYTSFDGKTILSSVTPLKDFELNPTLSTEPEAEPWTTPSADYKWYDPTTFAYGSYGSTKEAPVITIPDLTTIASARQVAENTTVTVEGVITTTPGSWGSKGFYLQDSTGGVYVYQGTTDYHLGQKIKITAKKSTYNDEIELSDIVESTDEGDGTLPAPQVVTTVGDSNQGQVVNLEGVTVANIGSPDSNGTFEFDAVKDGMTTRVRVDNRIGFAYNDFTSSYQAGDVLNLTGVASIFKGTYQLKPRSADDFALADTSNPNPDNGLVNVQLLGINDLHGKIDQHYDLDIDGDGTNDVTYGGAEYLAAYIKQKEAEQPNSLLVGVGDLIGGSSPVSALFQDEPTVDILEAMGMDVNVVGNHEFDEGTTEFLRMVNGGDYPGDEVNRPYDGMNFPNLAANVVWKSGDHAGDPILPSYMVQEVAGEKIGFIGVVTQSASGMVMPSGIEDIEFTDPVVAINDAVADLHAQGVHAIVVLAHSAASEDSSGVITGESASYVSQINSDVDVIFAAHNHTIDNGLVGNVLIVEADEYGKAFSQVNLSIDPRTHDVAAKNANIIWVDDNQIEADSEVSVILADYTALVAPKLNEVEGVAAHDMTGGYAEKGEKGDNALGNLIADSMRTAMNSDFAMMNGGGIRDNLLAGDITYSDLFNILPFNNILETVEIKGSDLESIVNAQLSTYFGPDYSISGFKYTWDGSTGKAVDITFPDGNAIDPSKTYTLTVNNFMATATSSKYKAIGDAGKNPVTGPEDLEALVAYVKSFNDPIDYVSEGRISEIDGGSTPDPEPTGDITSIADAYTLADDTEVTVEGVVTIKPGSFGASHSFYIEDNTGAINVYSYDDPGFNIGDKVKLTATKSTYSEEVELKDITASVVEGQVELNPQVVSTLDASLQFELVQLKDVKVTNISSPDNFGSFSFDAVNGDNSTAIYVDNRTGITYDDFAAKVKEGDFIDVTGIVDEFNGSFELKPRILDDFIILNKKVSIADARAIADGTTHVEGVVTFKDGDSTYIQDSTAGIVLYGKEVAANVGDKVEVIGELSDYKGLLELVNFEASVKESGVGVPAAKEVTSSDLGEDLEGQLVTLQMVKVDSDAGYGEFNASDAAGSFVIDNNDFVEIGKNYKSITGIVTYNYGAYKLVPRMAEDVIAIPNVTLAEARTIETGTTVQVEGIVTYKDGKQTYIQDETAGIMLYGTEITANVGDKVEVIGELSEFKGLLELVNFEASVKEAGVGVPAAKEVTSTDLGEELEGQLVKLTKATVDSDAGYGEFNASDAAGSFVIDNNDFVEIGRKYESITGVLTYNFGAYKLVPRSAEDVVLAPEEVLIDKLLTGDETNSEDVAEGFIELVENGSISKEDVIQLIENALYKNATNQNTLSIMEFSDIDHKTEQTIKRIMKQINNLLERVEKEYNNHHAESTVNEQVRKQFVHIIEKDINGLLNGEKKED